MEAVKKVFKKSIKLKERLKFKKDHLESLKVLRDNVNSSMFGDGIKTSGHKNKKEDIICKIIDLEREIVDDILSLIEIKLKVNKAVKTVENTELALLLELRYVHYKTWSDIAQVMNYSEYWVRGNLHTKAIKAVKNNYGEFFTKEKVKKKSII